MKASDIMTRDVVTIRSAATVAEAIHLMQERGWRSLIVDREDEQDAYGIITATDIAYKVTAAGREATQVRVSEVMTKPCIVVNPDLSVEYVAQLFAHNRLLRAPVIQGQLLGIISVSDLLVKGQLGTQLQALLPQSNLQELVQSAPRQSGAATQGSQPSHHSLETAWETALQDYFDERSDLREPEILDNFCSG